MAPEAQFVELVADAYEHLYDLVYLRSHPLLEPLVPGTAAQRRERAWELHRSLLTAIDELDPGPQAPIFSHEWRRHRLMVLRYVDGLDPPAVAEKIGISLRHFYRDRDAAVAAAASILWERCRVPSETPTFQKQVVVDEAPVSRLALLRLEAAHMAQAERWTRLDDVLDGVLSLLQNRLQQRRLETRLSLPDALPAIAIEHSIVRQMLVGALGYLVERAEGATIAIEAHGEGAIVRLSLVAQPGSAVQPAKAEEAEERVSTLGELGALRGARVETVEEQRAITGFQLHFPTSRQRTVLVVDDNEDVLELFQCYLGTRNYRVVAVRTAQEALALARGLQPDAITLDLMMADRDGWDVLQTLTNQPDTCRIPVIVCSVLREKELALSLGAAAFLEKPVTEKALLGTLQALEHY